MLKHSGPLLALLSLAAIPVTAAATTIHIDGSVVCGFNACDGNPEGDYGEVSIDLEATGLPIPFNQDGTTAPVTKVSALLTLNNGKQFSASNGSGFVASDDYGVDVLDLDAGSFEALLYVPEAWVGNGPLLGGDSSNSAFLAFGNLDYHFGNGESKVVTTVTPEPGSISLMLLGLGSTGCAWVGMGRRRLPGR